MDSKQIAADLKARALKAGFPIYTVCEWSEVSPSTFYRWEKGENATLIKIAAITKTLDRLEAEKQND